MPNKVNETTKIKPDADYAIFSSLLLLFASHCCSMRCTNHSYSICSCCCCSFIVVVFVVVALVRLALPFCMTRQFVYLFLTMPPLPLPLFASLYLFISLSLAPKNIQKITHSILFPYFPFPLRFSSSYKA